MPLFEWSKKYSVNISSIDAEHKVLFNLMNMLFDSLSEGKSHELVNDIVQEMDDYAKNHFQTEEFHFKKIGYPYLNEHKRLHNYFIGEVAKFKDKVIRNEPSVSIKLIEFLRDWFIEHIMRADMQYVPYFKENGIE
ncbi:MAG: bacteriohemerythrin [Perlabentimonas sp.]